MSERLANQNSGEIIEDPELLPSQLAVRELCQEILALDPEPRVLTFTNVAGLRCDPTEIQQRLRESSLGDLMLQDGDTLSALRTDDYYPELDLFVGSAKLDGVMLRAWGWDYPKYRRVSDQTSPKQSKMIDFPGEKDWQHQLDIVLWYTNGERAATQDITVDTSSSRAGILPSVSRNVAAMAYAETGYEGHNHMYREARSDDEVLAFVDLARELFEGRIQDTTAE